jgi:hypothetical protein
MKYITLILEILPKKAIAIYLLKKAKIAVKKTEIQFDDLAYEVLLNLLIKLGYINETEAINEEL